MAITLASNKTSIISGESITFTGTGTPGTTLNIFTEGGILGVGRTHLAQVTPDSGGNFTVSINTITNTSGSSTSIQVAACELSGIPGIECSVLGTISNYVNINVQSISCNTPLLTVNGTTGTITVAPVTGSTSAIVNVKVCYILNAGSPNNYVLDEITNPVLYTTLSQGSLDNNGVSNFTVSLPVGTHILKAGLTCTQLFYNFCIYFTNEITVIVSNPVPVFKYKCVNGTCTGYSDGTGIYPDKASCIAAEPTCAGSGGGAGTCGGKSYDSTKNYCFGGQSIPKDLALIGGVFMIFMMMNKQ